MNKLFAEFFGTFWLIFDGRGSAIFAACVPDLGIGFVGVTLVLILIHHISIPITDTAVNPARSLSQALSVHGAYLLQVWLFWVAPIADAIVGGFLRKAVFEKQ